MSASEFERYRTNDVASYEDEDKKDNRNHLQALEALRRKTALCLRGIDLSPGEVLRARRFEEGAYQAPMPTRGSVEWQHSAWLEFAQKIEARFVDQEYVQRGQGAEVRQRLVDRVSELVERDTIRLGEREMNATINIHNFILETFQALAADYVRMLGSFEHRDFSRAMRFARQVEAHLSSMSGSEHRVFFSGRGENPLPGRSRPFHQEYDDVFIPKLNGILPRTAVKADVDLVFAGVEERIARFEEPRRY